MFHQKPHTYVSHVALKVMDLTRSLDFYQTVLGLKVQSRAEGKVVLTADGKKALLTLEQPEHVTPLQHSETGLYHFALLLPSRADLGRMLRHFLLLRQPLQGASDHLVSEAIYLSDPDGNGIEVYADRPPSTWKWNQGNVDMATIPLDAEGLISEAGNEEWQGIPVETIMGHIHLQVAELSKSGDFYTNGLGFDAVLRYGPQALFVSTGGYHHHIGLNTWNSSGAVAPKESSVGLHYFTIVFPNQASLKAQVEKVKQTGAVVNSNGDYFTTVDPSGIKMELVVQESE